MSESGIVRKIDDLGRIVLPVEIRRKLGIGIGCPLEVFFADDQIILKKATPQPDFLSLAQKMAKTLSLRINSAVYLTNDNDVLIKTTKKPLSEAMINLLIKKVQEEDTPTGIMHTEHHLPKSYYAVPLNTPIFYGLLIAVFDKYSAGEKDYLATTLTADLLTLLLS